MKNLAAHNGSGLCMKYSSTGDQIITAGNDKNVCFWNFKSAVKENYIKLGSNNCSALAVSKDNELLCTALTDNSIQLFNMKSTTRAKNKFNGHNERITGVHFLPFSKQCASTSFDG